MVFATIVLATAVALLPSDPPKSPPTALTEAQVKALWADLASDDAAKAYKAHWALVAAPGQAIELLKKQMQPVVPPDAKLVGQWLAELDANDFSTRDRAMAELGKLGPLVEPALRKAVDGGPSPEARRRMEQLLDQLQGPIKDPNRLRMLRAVETLERIASPDAKTLLETLAKGAPEGELTREAKSSLERLNKLSR